MAIKRNWDIEPAQKKEEQPKIETYFVTVKYLNIRQKPAGEIIGYFTENEEVQVLSIKNEWAKVKTDSGEGYVMKEYITKK